MVRSHLIPLILAGPTGSGKSALALALAEKHGGEIVCADSRQFYVGMRIGTAGPTDSELARVRHHGFNSIDPMTTKFDAGLFLEFAYEKIAELQRQGIRPILVGGTGLYLRSLRYGFGEIARSDERIVQELEQECEDKGLAQLYDELAAVDPVSATVIKPSDRYRIIRALEIYRQSGEPASLKRKSFLEATPQLSAHWVLKKMPRAELEHRLFERVSHMFGAGLIEEAIDLAKRLPRDHWVLKIMGYQEALQVVDGSLSLAQGIERAFIRHRQYAKRQNTWFKKEVFYRMIIS